MFRWVERFLMDLAAASIAALGILITVSVMLRAVFNSGIPDSVVIVAELMVAAIVLPFAATIAARANIVVEVISGLLPIRVQDALIVFGGLFGLFALLPLIWSGWKEAISVIEGGSFYFGELQLPKWPGRVLFLFGISVAWIRLFVQTIGDIMTIGSGEHIDQESRAVEDG